MEIREEFGRFDAFIWRFVDGKPIVNELRTGGLPGKGPGVRMP